MSSVTYEQLVRVPLVRQYEESFRKTTGILLKLVPPGVPATRLSLDEKENPFCRLVAAHASVGEACWKVEAEVLRRAGQTLTPHTGCCLAGLHLLAAPVVVDGRHVANWIGGQVFHHKPTQAAFRRVANELARLGLASGLDSIKAAFFSGRVVAKDQFEASLGLLQLLAQHLAQTAAHLCTVSHLDEPACVARAKGYVRDHLTQPIRLLQVAAFVRVSPYHFCRVFRAGAGMTLTEYIARLRVERAQALLANASLRISEVAYAAGFGSIPQFNAVFRQHAGVAPTQYRAAQRQRPAAARKTPAR